MVLNMIFLFVILLIACLIFCIAWVLAVKLLFWTFRHPIGGLVLVGIAYGVWLMGTNAPP